MASLVWRFITLHPCGQRMSCQARHCTYKNVRRNATRARRHLRTCTGALALYPDLAQRLADADRPHAAGPVAEALGGALPPIPANVLAMWRTNFAAVLLQAGLPFGLFDTAAWRSVFLLISGGRIDGPGGRRAVGGALLTSAVAAVDSSLARFLEGCHSVSLSIDGMTDASGGGVYNVVIYTPRPFLVATFRMGSEPSTAANLLTRLQGALQAPLLSSFATSATTELAAGASVLSLFGHRRVLALVTDSPTTMVALRGMAVASGSFLFAFGCGAHAANLVAQDAARVPICAQALRAALLITVFFTRSTRAHALLRAVRARLPAAGRRVGSLKTYSRTRWAGEGATIAAVGSNLPALDHTLLENTHSPSPFDVPTPVTDAIRSPAVRSAIDGCVPFLLFLARLVAHMEGDATPLSSYVAIFACLRASLANHFTGLSVAARQAMQSSIERRYTSFSDPLVALAFWLDPFWAPVRTRLSCLLWGTKSLATLRDAAVVFLCRPDNAARALVLAELASFADTEQGPAALEQSRDLHPVMWWRLWGWRFPTLQPLAVRLLAIPPSAAGGERIFKALKTVLSTRRSRLAPERVDNQTR